MEWLQFEHEIRDLVEAFGYQAEATTPSHDFGVDVIAHSNRRTVVVQCKLYGKGRIGGDTMMKLVGSRQYFKAANAICITTSRFTKQAKEIAENEDIKLVDREKLILLCRERNLTIPSLTVLTCNDGSVTEFADAQTSIGREPHNHIVLDLPQISRRHALLTRHKLSLTLSDCGSTNGTFVNEQRVVRPVVLNYGDQIKFWKIAMTIAMQLPNGEVLSHG